MKSARVALWINQYKQKPGHPDLKGNVFIPAELVRELAYYLQNGMNLKADKQGEQGFELGLSMWNKQPQGNSPVLSGEIEGPAERQARAAAAPPQQPAYATPGPSAYAQPAPYGAPPQPAYAQPAPYAQLAPQQPAYAPPAAPQQQPPPPQWAPQPAPQQQPAAAPATTEQPPI